MNILLIGSGGREHAIAWKLAQSPKTTKLSIAPGNPGCGNIGENVAIPVDDIEGIVEFAKKDGVDMVVIGPEKPLDLGLSDRLRAEGFAVFGPSHAAAKIEASKAYAKEFMDKYNIPTARFKNFTNYDEALAHLKEVAYEVVIKASGLAAGKGVILPETDQEAEEALRDILLDKKFGDAGSEVVIEERMTGPEASVLAFTDGKTVIAMAPAQDHKRIGEGDTGLNTGGMGVYAPAPVCTPALQKEIFEKVLQPAVDGLRAEGSPYVGVIYAGMMLTPNGPSVLEFNARFGDPETQTLLPLLKTDLVEVAQACVDGKLDELNVEWYDRSVVCVIMASGGYPEAYQKGLEIKGLDDDQDDTVVFHAGTRQDGDKVVTAGGRVLGVTSWGSSFDEARRKAYQRVEAISFEGAYYRKDIGAKR
ncbi:MAG: phosphoribosylamine--glycine ligase [Anaerolineaceae bacterium]|nr:phosphoribosylamine--glycine ligase [Anaerolineaceae bacterium]